MYIITAKSNNKGFREAILVSDFLGYESVVEKNKINHMKVISLQKTPYDTTEEGNLYEGVIEYNGKEIAVKGMNEKVYGILLANILRR